MEFRVTHETGMDFGAVAIELDRTDDFRVSGNREDGITIEFSVYNREAAELVALLEPVATAESL